MFCNILRKYERERKRCISGGDECYEIKVRRNVYTREIIRIGDHLLILEVKGLNVVARRRRKNSARERKRRDFRAKNRRRRAEREEDSREEA